MKMLLNNQLLGREKNTTKKSTQCFAIDVDNERTAALLLYVILREIVD